MKEEFKKYIHWGLALVSVCFSGIMFFYSSTIIWLQVIWVTFSTVAEMLKLYLGSQVKYLYLKKMWINLVTSSFLLLGLSIVSGFATMGFAKLSIKSASDVIVVEQAQSNLLVEKAISSLENQDNSVQRANEQIDILLKQKQDIKDKWNIWFDEHGASGWGTSKMNEELVLVDNDLSFWLSQKEEYENKVEDYVEEYEVTEVKAKMNVSEIYSILGESFGLTGSQMLFYIFLAVVFIIELSLFITAEPLQVTETKWSDYLLFTKEFIADDGKVVDIKEASKSSGVCLKQAKTIVADLQRWKWKNTPIIEKKDKGWLTKLQKSTIISYIETLEKMAK